MSNNSAARARRLAVSTVAEIDEDTRNLHSYAVIAIVLSALTVLGMWALNAFVPQGYGRGVVMVIAFIGLLVMATAALHPKFLFWAAGLGAIVEGLNDRDITQGSVQGVRVYFRVVSGALFYFTASAVILAIIPFTKAPSVFWGFALIIIAVSTLFAYLNVDTGKWKVRIVVTSVIVLSLLLAAKLLLPEGVLQLGTSSYNALDRDAARRAAIIELCSKEPSHKKCSLEDSEDTIARGPAMVPAGKSGSAVAPATKWSEWRKFDKTGLCFRAWTANPDVDDVRVRYMDREGEKWSYGGGYIHDVVAISFTSKIGMPVRTYYETWEKVRGKNCTKA